MDKTSFSPGDRVAGIIHGCQYSHTGAFAEYLVADANRCFKVPGSLPLEKACTIGVGWVSAMQALHQRLYHNDKGLNGNQDTEGSSKILLPASKYFTWWENLAAGLLCGYKHRHAYHPASTDRSPRNTHHSHCLPATSPHVTRFRRCKTFEYNSPSLIEDIGKLERNVRRGIDCHSEGRSTVRAAECMLSNEKPETCAPDDRRRLIRTLPPGMISGTVPASVRADEWILSYTALGKVLFPFRPSQKSKS